MDRDLPCSERVGLAYESEIETIEELWQDYCAGKDISGFEQYGLGFDYVDGEKPYYRWQLSWGGPSDEFRFFTFKSRYSEDLLRIEYWFMDWYDGAHVDVPLGGDEFGVLEEIFQWFMERR